MKKLKFSKESIPLIPILILSAILNLANIGIEGYANQYYAAGVKSMTLSLKNFFFVSFDPGAFVSIDKPPVGFWIQAISAKILGFSGFSILLPQALAGIISVYLVYVLVKRTFGNTAGLISALCLAITPVFVAVSRNNTIDNLLVMTLLFASLALLKAAEQGKLKYLIISLVLVGVGFNIKMLQAYMIIPAVYITYLLSSTIGIKKKFMHFAAGTAILIVVSLSWAVIVDMVPASQRPFVGSSTDNSVMELIIGHNGLERLGLSGNRNPGNRNWNNNSNGRNNEMSRSFNQNDSKTRNGSNVPTNKNQNRNNFNNNFQGNMPGGNPQGPGGSMPPAFNGGNPGGGGGGSFGGSEQAGLSRLFSSNDMSDQITWLFPLAIFGFAAALLKEFFNGIKNNSRVLSLIFWFMWLTPEFIYFSFTKGLFHPYYLTMMAAPIAALTGIGIQYMWELYKEGSWKAYIMPAALTINGAVQILLIYYYYNSSNIAKVLLPIVAILCFLPSIVLAILNLIKIKTVTTKVKFILLSAAFAGLLISPVIWSSTAIFHAGNGTFPAAGLSLISSKGMRNFNPGNFNQGNDQQNFRQNNQNENSNNGGNKANNEMPNFPNQPGRNNNMNNNSMGPMGDMGSNNNTKLIEYLKAHKTTEKYLVAVPSAMGYASDIILKTGEPVMTLGGFSGSDNILTLDEFKKLVKDGTLRYAMMNGRGPGGGGGPEGSSSISSWVQQNGKAVSGFTGLYDLKSANNNSSSTN